MAPPPGGGAMFRSWPIEVAVDHFVSIGPGGYSREAILGTQRYLRGESGANLARLCREAQARRGFANRSSGNLMLSALSLSLLTHIFVVFCGTRWLSR